MGERDGATKVSAAAAQPPRPTISVPPPASFETLFGGGSVPGFSPGPMTLVSSMFSPDSSCCSFSQLLAGAMASPIAKPAFLAPESNLSENRPKEVNPADGSDKRMGYKQNRPMGLMVAQSPLLLVPPGLSPSGFLNSPGFLSPLLSPFGMSHQQALAHVTAQAAFSQSFLQMQAGHQHSSIVASTETLEPQPSSVPGETLQQHLDNVPSEPQCLKMESSEATQSDKKPTAMAVDKPADDGYNWRKYGQKLVKAKEHPRSYYKCTHLNCPVKKKVEWAPDGHITEITYKGQHNHEVPQPNIQAKDRSNAGTMNSRGKPEFGLKSQTEMDALNEIEASNLGVRKQKAPTQLSSGQLPVNSEHDEMEDSAIVIDEENADDEPNAKKRSRKVGACVPTITEPKIVVQTRSEVDLLDDGYKWRKYGQKVVKGNPHPRSYYRCTYAGCNVRKHVERASTDPKAVITTYEGKHNHHTPTGRNNSQSIADSASMRLKPQKVAARKLSIDRGMDFDNKDQMQVLSQLKEGEIAA